MSALIVRDYFAFTDNKVGQGLFYHPSLVDNLTSKISWIYCIIHEEVWSRCHAQNAIYEQEHPW